MLLGPVAVLGYMWQQSWYLDILPSVVPVSMFTLDVKCIIVDENFFEIWGLSVGKKRLTPSTCVRELSLSSRGYKLLLMC